MTDPDVYEPTADDVREWAENAYSFIESSVRIIQRARPNFGQDGLDMGWADRLIGEGQNLGLDPQSIIARLTRPRTGRTDDA